MPNALDHLFALVLAVLFPVRAALYGYRRLTSAEPDDVPRVRLWLYRQGIAIQWTLVALAVALWVSEGRSWRTLGVVPQATWGLGGVLLGTAIVGLYVLHQRRRALQDDESLARVRHQLRHLERMMPHSAEDSRWFNRLAVTAGVCEEVLYRGYLLWYLGAWLSLPQAVVAASVVFGFGHAYQGPRGIAVTAAVGLFMCGVYLVSGSLLACMVIHALMDLHAGSVARAAFALEDGAPGPAVESNGTPHVPVPSTE